MSLPEEIADLVAELGAVEEWEASPSYGDGFVWLAPGLSVVEARDEDGTVWTITIEARPRE